MPPPPQQASGRAIAALVLGIVSIVMCGCMAGFIAGIPAAILGKMELNAIERGQAPAAGKGLAAAGFWIGAIVSGCSCLTLIGYVIFMISVGASGGYNY
jgi:hypothetical protein